MKIVVHQIGKIPTKHERLQRTLIELVIELVCALEYIITLI